MKKVHVLKNPTSITNLADLDELDLTSDWELKAQKLVSRREKRLRDQDAW